MMTEQEASNSTSSRALSPPLPTEEENDESINNRPAATTRRPPKKKEGKKRHGARNQDRHKEFVKWLEAYFPDSFRQSACQQRKNDDATNINIKTNTNTKTNTNNSVDAAMHILDVAGGKGELSARLSMCLLQKVVMIDPRPADVVHCFESLVLPKIPNKWQKRLEDQRATNPNFIRDKLDERFRQLVTTFDVRTLATCTDIQDAVQNASLLIGLHSDGATEAIVDAALEYQKPFVVVPCCVFPNLFPQRRVVMKEGLDSVAVRSHEHFCQFLLDKHPGFRMETLPFDGRNLAICWDGVTTVAKNNRGLASRGDEPLDGS